MNEQELQQVLGAYDQQVRAGPDASSTHHLLDEPVLTGCMWLQEAKVHNGEHPASNGEVVASGVFDPRVKLNDRNELAALQLAEAKCLSLLSLYPTTLQVHLFCPLLFLSLSLPPPPTPIRWLTAWNSNRRTRRLCEQPA